MFPFFHKYMSNWYKYLDFDAQRNQTLKPYLIGLLFMYRHIRPYPWIGTCVRQMTDELQAALPLGNVSVRGRTKVGVSMHNHIAHYLLGLVLNFISKMHVLEYLPEWSPCHCLLDKWIAQSFFYRPKLFIAGRQLIPWKRSQFIVVCCLKHASIVCSIPFWLKFYQRK